MFTAICKRIGVWVVQKGRLYLVFGVLCLLGSVTLTANAILTVSNSGMFGDADVTVDSAGTLNVGTASSTVVVIGKSGIPVTVPGNVAINGTLTLGSASTTGQLLFHIASSSFTTLLQASSSQASNLTFTLPTTSGTAGQAMLTDGAGNLFFGNPGSSQWLNGTSGTISYSSGSIGINTTTPLALLSIVGSATSTAPLFDIASSSGTSLFRVSPNGTVTICSTLPGGCTTLTPTLHQIYAVGDSLTADGTYVAALQALLGANWHINNRGISGQGTAIAAMLFPQAVLANTDGEYLILWLGINDVAADATAAATEANLQAMITAAHNAGMKVVSVNVTPFKGNGFWSAPRQTVLDAINAWLATTATNVDYRVNAWSLLVDPATANTLLPTYDDGSHLHLSTAGYTAIANAIYTATTWTGTATTSISASGSGAIVSQNLRKTDTPTFAGIAINGGMISMSAPATADLGPGVAATAQNTAGERFDSQAGTQGTEWIVSDTGAGYGFRLRALYDATLGSIWVLEKRNNSGTFTRVLEIGRAS